MALRKGEFVKEAQLSLSLNPSLLPSPFPPLRRLTDEIVREAPLLSHLCGRKIDEKFEISTTARPASTKPPRPPFPFFPLSYTGPPTRAITHRGRWRGIDGMMPLGVNCPPSFFPFFSFFPLAADPLRRRNRLSRDVVRVEN